MQTVKIEMFQEVIASLRRPTRTQHDTHSAGFGRRNCFGHTRTGVRALTDQCSIYVKNKKLVVRQFLSLIVTCAYSLILCRHLFQPVQIE